MELDLQSIFGLQCKAVYLLAETPQLLPSPRIWAHLRGRYWSAKMDDPLILNLPAPFILSTRYF
jgi:hypothetical protein